MHRMFVVMMRFFSDLQQRQVDLNGKLDAVESKLAESIKAAHGLRAAKRARGRTAKLADLDAKVQDLVKQRHRLMQELGGAIGRSNEVEFKSARVRNCLYLLFPILPLGLSFRRCSANGNGAHPMVHILFLFHKARTALVYSGTRRPYGVKCDV